MKYNKTGRRFLIKLFSKSMFKNSKKEKLIQNEYQIGRKVLKLPNFVIFHENHFCCSLIQRQTLAWFRRDYQVLLHLSRRSTKMPYDRKYFFVGASECE